MKYGARSQSEAREAVQQQAHPSPHQPSLRVTRTAAEQSRPAASPLQKESQMILIFASRPEDDPHLILIRDRIKRAGEELIILNPHGFFRSRPVLLQKGEETRLFVSGQEVRPRLVYMSTLWRADCIIDTPPNALYPAVFRARIGQFLKDISFALENCKWTPGHLRNIERAESKPYLLQVASGVGITVPKLTADAFTPEVLGKPLYKKQLGHPFTISINLEKGEEVGVTTTNVPWEKTDQTVGNQPWQWQELIESVAQLRCCVVGEDIWTSVWEHSEAIGVDFRLINEMEGRNIPWKPYALPQEMQKKLILLNRKLGLEHSCPEFLITKEGELVLIDLNPCGDWYGFFQDSEHHSIASSLVSLFLEEIKG